MNNLGYTPGSGASISTIQASSDSSHVQLVVLSAAGATGDRSPLPTDATYGLGVQVLKIDAGVTFAVVNNGSNKLVVDASQVAVPVTDNSASLTVDAPAATPVAVRLSTGSAFIDTIPVSVSGTATVAGTVAISGTPAVSQSGTWNIGTVTSITNAVTVAGTVAISGTPTVQGTVTSNQGTPAAVGNAWVVKITDGTNAAGVTNVSGAYALKVDVVKQVGGGYSQQDGTAFTPGTTPSGVDGGLYNDAAAALSAGQSGALRITQYRGAHVNLRKNDGTEIGTSANPVYVQTVAADSPINVVQIGGNAVATAAAGVQKVGLSDASGNAYTDANPLPVAIAPRTGKWRAHLTLATSQTNVAVHTPAGGKTVYVEGWILTVNTSDVFVLSDNNQSDSTDLYKGQPTTGTIVCNYPRPEPLAAVNDVLRYSSGTTTAGDLTIWGYDA